MSRQRHRARLTMEALSDRIVPATGVLRNSLSQLVITGTSGDDSAVVSVSGKNVVVDFNGVTSTFSKVRSVVFKGLDGDDTFVNNTSLPAKAEGGNGNDSLTGGAAADAFFGGAGDDRLTGMSGNDRLFGEAGDDRIFGDNGNDSISGGSGNDDCNGGNGNDGMSGDDGDDRLVGGSGRDHLRGGRGSDRSVRDSNDSFDDSDRSEGIQNKDGLAEVEGTISGIDGQNVTIRTRGGVDVQVIIDANTVLEKNGAHVALAAFAIGDAAEAKYNATTKVAFKLESGEDANDDNGGGAGNGGQGRSQIEGTISAVGTDSVSIRQFNGTVVTLKVNASTKLERNDLHVSLSAFKVGDRGEARFDPASLLASKVEAVGA